MGYKRSAALRRFAEKTSSLHRLIRAARRIKLGGKSNAELKGAMRSGSVVLAFGHFEGYYREVIEDICSSLSDAGSTYAEMPVSFRTHAAVACRLEEWGSIQNPQSLSERIWAIRAGGGFDTLLDENRVSAGIASDLMSGITYPKLDNIRKMLARLGIADPLAKLRATARLPIDQYLTSFHDARVDLAHNGTPPGWAESDFENQLERLHSFARVLDRVLFQWFCQRAGMRSWPG